MSMNRREFLLLMAALVTGCQAVNENAPSTAARKERVVNAGPVSNYAPEGVYPAFRGKGFFIVRRGGKLFAISAICTHRKCKLDVESDHSFYCPCHGSTFDQSGHVTHGPARRDLPALATSVNESGELLVTVWTI
jgi:Rieske Fe-S protein